MRTPAGLLFGITLAALAGAQTEPKFTDILPGPALEGWRGGDTFDHRQLQALTPEARATKLAVWMAQARLHWRPEGRELLTTGKGPCLATEREYGDIEFQVEYLISPRGDSGIYLRNVPQVQIWDPEDQAAWQHGAAKGSGGLWNNTPGTVGRDPLVRADKPVGQWNGLRVKQLGERVSVWLNGTLVVDHVRLENMYDRAQPVPATGPLLLQSHGDPVRWRNLLIREIPSQEAQADLAQKNATGFSEIFDGKTLSGWRGALNGYEVHQGLLRNKPGQSGVIFTEGVYDDFTLRLEFRLPKGGNNGLALRYPGTGIPAYDGFTECQVLDGNFATTAGYKIDPRQVHGSAYGLVGAAQGYQLPAGQWNFKEVTLQGTYLTVELNGTRILAADLSKVDVTQAFEGKKHPGLKLTQGHLGLAGHGDPVEFRNLKVKRLKK